MHEARSTSPGQCLWGLPWMGCFGCVRACAGCNFLVWSPVLPLGFVHVTAGVVVTLARKYRVSLPILTAVAQVLNGHLNAKEAVYEIMNLPQIEER